MKLQLLLLLAFAISTLTNAFPRQPNVTDRLYNAQVAYRGQFPWHVSLIVSRSSGISYCNGALLSDRFVITAGNCCTRALEVTVSFGSNNPPTVDDENRVTIPAITGYWPPNFTPSPQVKDDLVLVELSSPVTNNALIQPISIPSSTDMPVGGVAVVSGWGVTSNSQTGLNRDLLYGTVRQISNYQCAQIYGYAMFEDDKLCTLSATSIPQAICGGDQGAPLVYNISTTNQVLVGLGSFHDGHCESKHPSGFTRVYPFVDFIRAVINGTRVANVTTVQFDTRT